MTVIETAPAVTPIEVAEPNEAQRILLEARDLIASAKQWRTGWGCAPGAWCAVGAVARVWGISEESRAYTRFYASDVGQMLRQAAEEMAPGIGRADDSAAYVVFCFNDAYGHAAVMRMFNRAIELAA